MNFDKIRKMNAPKCKKYRSLQKLATCGLILYGCMMIIIIVYTTLKDDDQEQRDSPSDTDTRTLSVGLLGVNITATNNESIGDEREKCQKPLTPGDLEELLMATAGKESWEWMISRITQMWPKWRLARDQLQQKHNLRGHFTKKVLVFPLGLITSGFSRRSMIKKGGPLGEMLQWADLIAGLHVLGHDVILETHTPVVLSSLMENIQNTTATEDGCPANFDLIYLDYSGFAALPTVIKQAFKCRFRLLDVFGTQVMYTNTQYAAKHRLKTPIAMSDCQLHLKQFYTFYPQTPDNTFLGFVVTGTQVPSKKDDIAVLYGKDPKYAQQRKTLIDRISKYMAVHYTMSKGLSTSVSGPLINDGVLSSLNYARLLDRAKVVVGLGHPIEGTGAMEALAHGCIFINPKYVGEDQKILINRGKPTQRLVTSQIPYMEQFIGPPHVYTVDPDNSTQIISAIKQALNQTNSPLVPEEFTILGYLHRLSVYVRHQDFCSRDTKTTWPPLSYRRPVLGSAGADCSHTCHSKNMVCEPMYFMFTNDETHFTSVGVNCTSVSYKSDIVYPAVTSDAGQCVLQQDDQLFSCAGHDTRTQRLCPCRAYRKYQVALPS